MNGSNKDMGIRKSTPVAVEPQICENYGEWMLVKRTGKSQQHKKGNLGDNVHEKQGKGKRPEVNLKQKTVEDLSGSGRKSNPRDRIEERDKMRRGKETYGENGRHTDRETRV